MKLYNRINYSTSLPYVTSNIITEYDLQKANISCLKYYNILDNNQYIELSQMPKSTREIHVGLMIKKDPNIYNYIKDGILKAKELFFKINNINDNEVIGIKNDAIFLLGTRQINCRVDDSFLFVPKNTYTFYMKTIYNMEFLYGYNQIDGSEILDIKGIKDANLEPHRDYMINFICTLLYMVQTCTIEDTLKYYNEFYRNYVNLKLPIGYYRELNAMSKFKINNEYLLDDIDSKHIQYININNNVFILRDLFSILSDIYFCKVNKR